jgi:hypothetical protein
MHSHANPNRQSLENSTRNAALQIGAGSSDDLAVGRLAKPEGVC